MEITIYFGVCTRELIVSRKQAAKVLRELRANGAVIWKTDVGYSATCKQYFN